jgi:glyoxylase-like metal-dependent hydrolase (beta-lactamase superfamily II)
MKLVDNLYVYLWTDQRENNCNSILIDGKTPLLIDPGHHHRTDYLLERISADGIDPGKIKVLIITHSHPDHFEGARAFQNASVKIGLSRQEERYIEEVGRPMYVQQGMTMPEYRVDFYVDEGTLMIGKHEFQTFITPGHSPGSLCLYWPRHKVFIAGDLIFMQGVGRTDLPGGDSEALKKSIERVAKLQIEYLIPGHGPIVQGADQVKANFEFIKPAFLDLM